MSKKSKNPRKECMGCKQPDIWFIEGFMFSCWSIDKYFRECPCVSCIVKPMCNKTCKPKKNLNKSKYKIEDVTIFTCKRKGKGRWL